MGNFVSLKELTMRKRYNLLVWVAILVASALAAFWSIRPSLAQGEQPAGADAHLIWQLPGDASAYQNVPFAPGEILVGFHRDQVRAAALLAELDAQFVE